MRFLVHIVPPLMIELAFALRVGDQVAAQDVLDDTGKASMETKHIVILHDKLSSAFQGRGATIPEGSRSSQTSNSRDPPLSERSHLPVPLQEASSPHLIVQHSISSGSAEKSPPQLSGSQSEDGTPRHLQFSHAARVREDSLREEAERNTRDGDMGSTEWILGNALPESSQSETSGAKTDLKPLGDDMQFFDELSEDASELFPTSKGTDGERSPLAPPVISSAHETDYAGVRTEPDVLHDGPSPDSSFQPEASPFQESLDRSEDAEGSQDQSADGAVEAQPLVGTAEFPNVSDEQSVKESPISSLAGTPADAALDEDKMEASSDSGDGSSGNHSAGALPESLMVASTERADFDDITEAPVPASSSRQTADGGVNTQPGVGIAGSPEVEEAPPQLIAKEGDETNEGGDKSPSTLVETAPVDSVDTQQAAEPVRAPQLPIPKRVHVAASEDAGQILPESRLGSSSPPPHESVLPKSPVAAAVSQPEQVAEVLPHSISQQGGGSVEDSSRSSLGSVSPHSSDAASGTVTTGSMEIFRGSQEATHTSESGGALREESQEVEEAPPQSIVKEGDEMNEGGDKSPSTLVGTAPASRIATSSTGHAPVDSVDTQQAAEPVRAAQLPIPKRVHVAASEDAFGQILPELPSASSESVGTGSRRPPKLPLGSSSPYRQGLPPKSPAAAAVSEPEQFPHAVDVEEASPLERADNDGDMRSPDVPPTSTASFLDSDSEDSMAVSETSAEDTGAGSGLLFDDELGQESPGFPRAADVGAGSLEGAAGDDARLPFESPATTTSWSLDSPREADSTNFPQDEEKEVVAIGESEEGRETPTDQTSTTPRDDHLEPPVVA